eukprot:TRINITY_DN1616_c0_g1_i4.p2 TRINITY_DN1616_c0_g1~~TRINITY_DN1616_c0_g1_i4.p2  ORF type:complete len:208 (-),score=59.80 TRINITY_DN1616_c0_g1_i4:87-710(-)
MTNDKEKAVELIIVLQEDEITFQQLKQEYLNQQQAAQNEQEEEEEDEEEEKMNEEQMQYMLALGQAIQVPENIQLKQYKMVLKLTYLITQLKVILVRMDLKMGVGKIAAQTGHAVLGAYKESINQGDQYAVNVTNWECQGQPKIVLKVNSLEQLLELQKKASEAQLITDVIHDFGKTQVEPNTITVCSIGPAPSEEIDKITGALKLL